MGMTRREALLFLASGLGAVALGTGKTATAKPIPLKFTPVRGFPSAWVVSRLQDTNWRAWGTELLTRWAGVRVGRFPWAVAPVVNATGVGSR